MALARNARVTEDPWLPLRVAAAAARFGLPVAGSTLGVLVERSPVPEGRWPAEALSDLLVLLGSGEGQVPDKARLKQVEESLDQCWDLLRQRRAKSESGENPNDAEARPVSEVEGYKQ